MLVACRGPPFPAAFALPPSPGPVAPLFPAGNDPSPAVDGRKPTNGRTPREGRRLEWGVSSGVMSPARRTRPGIVRRRRSRAWRARCHSRWRRRGEREGCPAMAPRAPVNGLRSPGCTPAWLHARLGLIFYSHFSRGCGGAGRGPGEKSNLPVTEPGVRGRRRDRIHRERLSEA